jgi:hypothetical protein
MPHRPPFPGTPLCIAACCAQQASCLPNPYWSCSQLGEQQCSSQAWGSRQVATLHTTTALGVTTRGSLTAHHHSQLAQLARQTQRKGVRLVDARRLCAHQLSTEGPWTQFAAHTAAAHTLVGTAWPSTKSGGRHQR